MGPWRCLALDLPLLFAKFYEATGKPRHASASVLCKAGVDQADDSSELLERRRPAALRRTRSTRSCCRRHRDTSISFRSNTCGTPGGNWRPRSTNDSGAPFCWVPFVTASVCGGGGNGSGAGKWSMCGDADPDRLVSPLRSTLVELRRITCRRAVRQATVWGHWGLMVNRWG